MQRWDDNDDALVPHDDADGLWDVWAMAELDLSTLCTSKCVSPSHISHHELKVLVSVDKVPHLQRQ